MTAMNITWTPNGWNDYLYFQEKDRKKCRKINKLIAAISRNPSGGEGQPEPLSYELSGKWSRRIDEEHRIVYSYNEAENTVVIHQCRFHYKK